MAESPRWDRSHGEYITGRAHLDGVDALAVEMETKWGNGRLRLLVTPELREKFDRQRYLLNAAVTKGQLDDVIREAARMSAAWRKLDAVAAAIDIPLSPDVWEVTLQDGTVAAIVPDASHRITPDGRQRVVYSLDEIGRILSHYREATSAKLAFPGAIVTRVEKTIRDPLDAIRTADGFTTPLDEARGDEMPF